MLVSEVHASSVRAVNYARTLGLPDTKAVFFAFDADEAQRVERDWDREALGVPLEIVEAPFRDLGDPLRGYLRGLTADPDVAVSVVMPELVFNGMRKLLHNQRALYIKRLLLFEPPRLPVERPLPLAMRVLVGFDGSDASRRALVHAAELVGRGGEPTT